MPIYTESIKQLLYEDDIEKMWASAEYEYRRVILSILWYSGARPIEVMPLKRKNILWGIDEETGRDFFQMKLETKKLAKAVGYVVDTRLLTSSRPMGMQANLYVETMIKWAWKLQPEDYMIVGGRTTRWLNKEMHKLSAAAGHVWSVYHMRHSVFTHMARNRASITALMYWKGASHPSSVMRYIHAAPAYMLIENQHRERNLYAKPRESVERYKAEVIRRPATEEEIKLLPEAEKEEEPENGAEVVGATT